MEILWKSNSFNRGGSISFSVTVNAMAKTGGCHLQNMFLSKIQTLKNRFMLRRQLFCICHNRGVKGWSITKRAGQYVSPEGQRFSETSYQLEIVEVTSVTLQMVALDLCEVFHQRSVLIHDYNISSFIRVAP